MIILPYRKLRLGGGRPTIFIYVYALISLRKYIYRIIKTIIYQIEGFTISYFGETQNIDLLARNSKINYLTIFGLPFKEARLI